MSRPQLFQQAEPNHGTTVTIVTFQAIDKEYVLAHQASLEEEIRSVLAPGQEGKIFKRIRGDLVRRSQQENKWCSLPCFKKQEQR